MAGVEVVGAVVGSFDAVGGGPDRGQAFERLGRGAQGRDLVDAAALSIRRAGWPFVPAAGPGGRASA